MSMVMSFELMINRMKAKIARKTSEEVLAVYVERIERFVVTQPLDAQDYYRVALYGHALGMIDHETMSNLPSMPVPWHCL